MTGRATHVARARQVRAPRWLALLVFGVAYFALSHLGLLFVHPAQQITALWPASGFALAVFAAVERRHWPRLAATVFVANLAAQLLGRGFVSASVGFAVANALEPVLAGWVLTRVAGRAPSFASVREVTGLVLAATAANAVTAVLGGAVAALALDAAFARAAVSWWLSDGLGMLAVAPVALALRTRGASDGDAPLPHRLLPFAATAAIALLVFVHGPGGPVVLHYPYALFPLLMWCALRLDSVGLGAQLALLSTIATLATVEGLGPFARPDFDAVDRVHALQGFLSVAVLVTLLVAAVMRERRRALEDVREHGHFLEAVLANLNDGVLACDATGHVTVMSPALRVMHGLPAEPGPDDDPHVVRLQTIPNVLAADGTPLAPTELPLNRALHEGVVRDVEYRIAPAGHPVRRVVANGHALRTPDGDALGAVLAVRDVTAERAAAEEAQAARVRLQAILDQASAVVAVKDLDGRYVLVNREWERTKGRTAAEALGRTDHELFEPADADEVRATDLEVLLSGERVEYERRDGERSRSVVKFPLVAPDGTIYATAGMATDSTARRRALADALAASRAKTEFVANMSHEIRTPLNGVIGMTELLLETPLSEEQREYAQAAAASGDALLALVNDVLDFSKIEAGKLELEQHDLELRDAVEDACEVLAASAHAKGLELVVAIDDAVPVRVRGDRSRLGQVLRNLVSNAIKFTDAGEVRVDVTPDGEAPGATWIRIDVRDTGIGIEPARLDELFHPFAQADGSITRRFGGTGLGLAISRQLAELMGGTITARSAPGAGSTFSFRVPLGAPTGPRVTRGARPALRPGARALVAVPHPGTREVAVRHLESRGLCCVQAAGGAEARARLRDAARSGAPVEVLVVDGALAPELDAAAVAAAGVPGAGVVLLVTPGARQGPAEEGCTAQRVAKPARRAALLDAVARALLRRGREAEDELAVAAAEEPAAARRPRVLVAEDNEVNRVLMSSLLAKRGIAADLAADGREALALLAERPYELVFMDCQMPELDGYAATRALRAAEARAARARVPVVAMTAHALVGDRDRCLAAGMDDYLAKPLRPHELDAVLARWTGDELAPDPAEPLEPLVDEQRLAELRADGEEVAAQLVELFAAGVPGEVEELRAAAAAGDAARVRFLAHKVKGTCRIVGAARVGELCRTVELDGPSPDALAALPGAVQETVGLLRAALGRVAA
jgi:PAS domain S-box-containing protein